MRSPGPLGHCSPVCSLGVWCCACGVLRLMAPVYRCVRLVCCAACAVSWATLHPFTAALPQHVVLCLWCPGPLGSYSPVCPLGVLCCVLCVRCPGPLGSSQGCSRPWCSVASAVSWATWLLYTGLLARCVVLRVRCPGPLVCCAPVCSLDVLCCVCGVLGHWAPAHRCTSPVCCVACAVSWATWLLFTDVPAGRVLLRVRCPRPLGSCSPVCPLGVLCCVFGVLGHLAAVHRCVHSACCLRMRCPGPLGHCSLVCSLGVWCCACGVLRLMAPVYRCVRLVCCAACAVSWATWLPFTAALPRRVVLCLWCPEPLGSYSPVCLLGVLCCVLCVQCSGPLGSSQGCSRPWCSVASAVSWTTWLLFTGLLARCVLLRVRCPGPLGCFAPVCSLHVLCCVCGDLGHWGPVHRCTRPVCCVACAVSWATWLLFTGVHARRVLLCVQCRGPLGSCSPVCPLGALHCVCGVLGHLAPVHRCPRSACCVASPVSSATWLLVTGVPARCVALPVRCPGPVGSCSPVCSPVVWHCAPGVLGHLAPVHQCVRSWCCVACAVSWATWLLYTSVPAGRVALRVRCPGPRGPCSPVCPPVVLYWVCGVLGQLAPVHRFARPWCCAACAVSWATWLLFTDVPARRVVLRVRCPGPLGSCSPVCPLGVFCCVFGVLGHLGAVRRCIR